MSRVSRLALGLCSTLCLIGCESGAEVKTVRGSVLFNGQPVENAEVVFWPKDDHKLGVFQGNADADGQFEIRPNKEFGEGKPGKYVALISLYRTHPGLTTVDPTTQAPIPGKGTNHLPPIYTDKARCPFVVDIKKGDNDLPPFNLEAKPGLRSDTRKKN